VKFWKKKREQVEQAVDDVTTVATELAEKTATIGPTGVLLLLGAAAIGAAATYYAAQSHKKKKAARSGTASSKSLGKS
jgi:uncharacterized protein HemX